LVKLTAPRDEELTAILERVVKRTLAMVRRRGRMEEAPTDALGHVQAEALQTGFLPRAEAWPTKPHTAFREGFSLHAGTHVHAHDRQGLEHLCRYGLRPAVSMKRLRILSDGRVELSLRRPMHDGTTAVAFTPGQFVRRLAAIVPPPRMHLTRYFGVFAPASKLRARLVKAAPKKRRSCWDIAQTEVQEVEPPPAPERPRRLDWSSLLARVFQEDVLRCPLRRAPQGDGLPARGEEGASGPRGTGHRRHCAAHRTGTRATRAGVARPARRADARPRRLTDASLSTLTRRAHASGTGAVYASGRFRRCSNRSSGARLNDDRLSDERRTLWGWRIGPLNDLRAQSNRPRSTRRRGQTDFRVLPEPARSVINYCAHAQAVYAQLECFTPVSLFEAIRARMTLSPS